MAHVLRATLRETLQPDDRHSLVARLLRPDEGSLFVRSSWRGDRWGGVLHEVLPAPPAVWRCQKLRDVAGHDGRGVAAVLRGDDELLRPLERRP